jgi:hypothetical protein
MNSESAASLRDRIAEMLREFQRQAWRETWDTTIVSQVVAPGSSASGLAVYTTIADGIVFQTPVLPGDDLVAFFGLPALH